MFTELTPLRILPMLKAYVAYLKKNYIMDENDPVFE